MARSPSLNDDACLDMQEVMLMPEVQGIAFVLRKAETLAFAKTSPILPRTRSTVTHVSVRINLI